MRPRTFTTVWLGNATTLTLDIIICTRNRHHELTACLQSLAAQTERPDSVLVVDASDCLQPLPTLPLSLRRLRARPGLPGQRNLGLANVTSALTTFLDDDVELAPTYLAAVKTWFATHTSCVGASGRITNDPVRPAAARAFRRLFDLANDDGILRRSGDVAYLRHPRSPTQVDVISGANMTFRRDALVGICFRESLGDYAYLEDADVALQVNRVGELWMLPDAPLIHHKSPTGRLPARSYVREVLRNSALLFVVYRRSNNLSGLHFARRITGRVLAYALIAARRLSAAPLLGALEGVRAAGSVLRSARAVRP